MFGFLHRKKDGNTLQKVVRRRPNSCVLSWDDTSRELVLTRKNVGLGITDTGKMRNLSSTMWAGALAIPHVVIFASWDSVTNNVSGIKSFSIEFSDYVDDMTYGVTMTCVNSYDIRTVDGFISIDSDPIGPDEMLDNVRRFLDFASRRRK